MSEPQFSLSDYLSTVQEVIQITFNEPVWVKAEIRNLNIKGGHYYLELAEKDESEPYQVCRRVNILRDYPDDKIKIYP